MSATNYYRHYSTDFVHGVVGLGAAKIGAYIVILDLIYDRGGPIPNDPHWIGGILGESSRMARSLISKLIEAGKLVVEVDGGLDNLRARKQREIDAKEARNSSERSANAARTRWQSDKNQTLSDASSIPSRARVQIPDTKEEPPLTGRDRATKGTRLPVDWLLPLDDETWALAQGMTREHVARTAIKFKNYWIAKSGKDATKIDWSRTWQNWVLSDLERKPNGTGPPQKPKTMSAKLTALMDQPLGETYGRSRNEDHPQTPVRAIRDR